VAARFFYTHVASLSGVRRHTPHAPPRERPRDPRAEDAGTGRPDRTTPNQAPARRRGSRTHPPADQRPPGTARSLFRRIRPDLSGSPSFTGNLAAFAGRPDPEARSSRIVVT